MLTAPVVNYPKPWTISSGANHWDLHVPMKIYGKQMTELTFGYTNGTIKYDDNDDPNSITSFDEIPCQIADYESVIADIIL